METKACTRCKQELPLAAFGKWARSKDGRFAQCKECRKGYRKGLYPKRKGKFDGEADWSVLEDDKVGRAIEYAVFYARSHFPWYVFEACDVESKCTLWAVTHPRVHGRYDSHYLVGKNIYKCAVYDDLMKEVDRTKNEDSYDAIIAGTEERHH